VFGVKGKLSNCIIYPALSFLSGVTILLSLTVFLNMVSETMPVTSDNPLLGILGPQRTGGRQPFGFLFTD